MQPRIGAVVVTYHPDLDRLRASLGRLVPQAERVVVIDNGSSCVGDLQALVATFRTVELVPLDKNVGIATGFNVGIDRLARGGPVPDWVLTMDQDSLLHEGAVATMLADLDRLGGGTSQRFGIVGARWSTAPPPDEVEVSRPISYLRRRADAADDLGPVGEFHRRHRTISSGSLIRGEVLESVRFRDELFIDQVDTAFCFDASRLGWVVAETDAVLMDHRIGVSVERRGSTRSYENGQRLYYIARNSTYLALRGVLHPIMYLVDVAAVCRSYVFAHGRRSVPGCLAIVLVGVLDGLTGRLGRREYRFVDREVKRYATR